MCDGEAKRNAAVVGFRRLLRRDGHTGAAQIAAQVPTASLVKVYTEDNDSNRLLGRPNGYTSKIAFADSRISKTDTDGTQKDVIERGGSIEVFYEEALG